MRRTAVAFVAVVALVAAACAGDDGDERSGGTTTTTTATTAAPTTTTTTPVLPGGELVACESPDGFTVGAPAEWSANDECTQFHPDPFDPPAATDERVAAITAYVDPVAFADVAAPDAERDAGRAVTAIDGLQAVRLVYDTSGEALYPPGTTVRLYAVDLGPGAGGEPRTLFLDTVGLPGFDLDRNAVVLDRMARSLDISAAGTAPAPGTVAAYGGGGGAFTVTAGPSGDDVCLRIPPGSEPECAPTPAADGASTVVLDDIEPVLAGVAGDDAFAVTAEGAEVSTTFLTVPIDSTDVRGFAFAFGPDPVDRLVLTDLVGGRVGEVPVGGGDGGDGDDGGVDPVGEPGLATVESDGFPRGRGEPALLVDVRAAGHDGFDRVVLEFEGSDAPTYRIGYVEPPVRQDASGNVVDVAGDAFLELQVQPASGADLAGDGEQVYDGPLRFEPASTEAVVELVRTGDFEAHLTWVAGVDRRASFAVALLDEPLRLVVDVVHGR